eukprot:NODE_1291_length_2533_cov_5.803408.p1 GENE.NODE_1291_length_2533_cov_5.803408~~NODE_1291_length_2533_cov_5.803408.p1  ORF type:complete len:653 (+),score=227.38 NODE_1291_length_2533_cov_5.803408:369-2327(+)
MGGAPVRGRALLRACTVGGFVAAVGAGTLAVREALRRTQTMPASAVPQAGRLLPTRANSADRHGHNRRARLPRVEEEAEDRRGERAASQPPPTPAVRFMRPLRAGRVPNASAQQAAQVPSEDDEKAEALPPVREEPEKEEDLPPPFPVATVLWAAARFSKPLWINAEHVLAAVPGEKVLGRDVRRQLRLIVGGLMGSGKSTLCRTIAHMLGGTWVNQDEFAHKGRGAKKAFLAEIERDASDDRVPVLLVDKINTMRQHRREILDAMQRGVAGDVVFVQMHHPDDPPNRLDNMLKLCVQRIHGRGEGHRTLMGSDPKLQNILRMTAGGVEPMDQDELSRYAGSLSVDVTLPPAQSVMQVLTDLDANGLLGRFHLHELVTQDRVEEAIQMARAAEEELKKTSAPAPAAGKKKAAKPPPLWYWVLDFNEDETNRIRAFWESHSTNLGGDVLGPPKDYHITLLYLGGGSDSEIAARHPHIRDGAQGVTRLRDRLQSMHGQEIEIELTDVVCDGSVAAAQAILPDEMCGNRHPHVTLALGAGVAPRMSNELLARKAANTSLKENLGSWLSLLGLGQYETLIASWCENMGAADVDEIAANAADVAGAVREGDQSVDEDQAARLRMILARAAQGSVKSAGTGLEPLQLRARVTARLRGE